jgi:hypothetical protein
MNNGLLPGHCASAQELVRTFRKLADDLEVYLANGPAAIDPSTTISDWAVAQRTVPALIGTVHRHPTILDGHIGISTEIVFSDLQNRLARSYNRWYRLGSPITPIAGMPQ